MTKKLYTRIKALGVAIIFIVLFWLPLIRALWMMNWRWVHDEYQKWFLALLLCWKVLITGREQ